MSENNLNLDQYSIIKTSSGIDGGYMAIDKIMKSNTKFSAVVAGEDILAVGALKRLAQENINVPEDVAITGFNNSIIAMCTNPELTSVDNKVEEISSTAVSILIDAIQGKNIPKKTVIKPEIIVRQST
jgi:DNA-binding LacI/PurR family transcriptional regulator